MTLDTIAHATGSRPLGWSSPSVYSNGDTPQAAAAEGVLYTLDKMDSDIIQRLKVPEGFSRCCLIRWSPSTWAKSSHA